MANCCDAEMKFLFELDVCVTVHHQHNDVSNQQDATTFPSINLFKSTQHVSGDKFAHPQEQFLTIYIYIYIYIYIFFFLFKLS